MTGPMFRKVDWELESIISHLDHGTIALPDLQRPFVWKASKVRDLLDSMFRGFPIGYLMLWAAPDDARQRSVGSGDGRASTLVIDGQQRLTSLYSVMRNKPVMNSRFQEVKIEIAFNPLDGAFEVCSAAHRKDPRWISSIGLLFANGESMMRIARDYFKKLETRVQLTDEERERVERNIESLMGLKKYPLQSIEISAGTDEEDIAEIFVRVNSQGQNLKESDFVLTLVSVHSNEDRHRIEAFCKDCEYYTAARTGPFNHVFHPNPSHLVRVAVGLGFRRAALRYGYLMLRGKDLETGVVSDETREEQFAKFRVALNAALDLSHWHEFLHAVQSAGFASQSTVSSPLALAFVYTLFLIGRCDFKVPPRDLRRAIARWTFMSLVSRRYSYSPESTFGTDLLGLRGKSRPEEFLEFIEANISRSLSSDFWSIDIVSDLLSSQGYGSTWNAYWAALILLEAKALFSNLKVSQLSDPTAVSTRASLEKHHLFPKKYLERIGVSLDRERNQTANFALVEWGDNTSISDSAPAEYFPKLIEGRTEDELRMMHEWHALPEGWHTMPFDEFVKQRRVLMSGVIRRGFESI